MEFCLSLPASEYVDALYPGHIGLCLKSLGVQELWPCEVLEPASYHRLGKLSGWGNGDLVDHITSPEAIGISHSPPLE